MLYSVVEIAIQNTLLPQYKLQILAPLFRSQLHNYSFAHVLIIINSSLTESDNQQQQIIDSSILSMIISH